MSDDAAQIASGSYIAQARDGSTANVTVYQFASPAPVDEATLAAALARLDEMPLDLCWLNSSSERISGQNL